MRELTVRGVILGALITIVFTAANVYLGLKVGLTFASSIPAAVISMAVLRALGGGTILENNMVQTQASAAGTLSSVIFVLPALIMVGHWHGFPFWQSFGVCAAGGTMGVLFTIPLRRAMVVNSTLPYPEGVAAAEILRVGHGEAVPGEPGAADIALGGLVSAAVSFAATGLHVLGEGISQWFSIGAAAFRLSTGFSLALLGAGYLVGIAGGLSMLLGAVLAWGVAVPVLTTLHPAPPGADIVPYATGLWAHQVRFMGAGVIGVAAIWSLAGLAGPTIAGVRQSLAASRIAPGDAGAQETDRDLSPRAVLAVFTVALLAMVAVFAAFLSGSGPAASFGIWGLVAFGCAFSVIFGFLVAAACGYMAGLVGSSSSPISGIAILATISTALLLLLILGGSHMLADAAGQQAAIALTLFIVSVVLATATVSNDNLQDLKTGLLVGATPWKQQAVLVVGCVVGAAIIPPVLDLLYHAYGFPGAMPDARMDAGQALAAPQATLMAAIARGIFGHALDWTSVGIGVAAGVVLILADFSLRRVGRTLPPLAVGIGLYLPPTVGVTLAVGAMLGWVIDRRLAGRPDAERARRRGVLLASGFIVGESLVGVGMAAVIGASGSQAPLAVVGEGFAGVAGWLGLAVFGAVAVAFAVSTTRTSNRHART